MINPVKPILGRLERVDLRQAWIGEASEFTPWLALPENVQLLGEAIGIELEVESHEKNVGPFRADILCRDTITGHYVLVENQLERTDHGHLGQLLTYAAGLDAVTIVWVASRFTDEHRAALDWLNNATTTGFNFFGLEIELWRIGASHMAPKFNVVSQPNDWSKSVKEQAAVAHAGQLTESQQRHLEFWTQFRKYLEDTNSPVITNRPSTDHWTLVPVGRSNFALSLHNNFQEGRSGIKFSMTGPDAKAHFQMIEERYKDEVDSRLAKLGPVEWRQMPNAMESQIMVRRLVSPVDPATWPELNAWMALAMMTMHDLFRPIVKTLDASTYAPAPDLTLESAIEELAARPVTESAASAERVLEEATGSKDVLSSTDWPGS